MDISMLLSRQSTPIQALNSHTASTSLTLPPEIWRIVIRSFSSNSNPDDLVFLWTICRYVSHGFKHDVEQLFLATHLKRILIGFRMTSLYREIEPLLAAGVGFQMLSSSTAERFGPRNHDIPTVFNRLSDNRMKAIVRAESLWGAKMPRRLAPTTEAVSHEIKVQSRLGHGKDLVFILDTVGDMHIEWKAFLDVLFLEAESYLQCPNVVSSRYCFAL